jgi:transcriptional regulator with XRE-family HTH domain
MARRRVTVPRLAVQTGMSPAYLYRRLSGETALDVEDLDRLALALDVSVISLLPAQERAEGITLKSSPTSALVEAQIGRAA